MDQKYLIVRKDGSTPAWPSFVLGARDRAASIALRAYAEAGEKLGYPADYIQGCRELADRFDSYHDAHGQGDPGASGRHIIEGIEFREIDDPVVLAAMAGHQAVIVVRPDKRPPE